MLRRVLLVMLLGAAAALVAVSPARADSVLYVVTGTADGAGSCGPYPGVPGVFACTTLRAAVAGSGTDDTIALPSGTYTLGEGELALTRSTNIFGGNAHDTVIRGNGASRVIDIAAGADVSISGVTISGGQAPGGDGGNILNAGSLTLLNARVTGGAAASGGGIATSGTTQIVASLIDGNTATGQGGGIADFGASVTLTDTTIFDNTAGGSGAGIVATGGGELLSMRHVTLAFNRAGATPGGVGITGGTWSSTGSLFAGNSPSNCAIAAAPDAGSVEDGGGCGFTRGNVATGLSNALSDQGGHTPVLTIPLSSPAKDAVQPCDDGFDQRIAPRDVSGACDAGAYEEGAVAPPVTGFQLPVPPTQTPPPVPTASPAPTPVAQKSVVGSIVSGQVLIKVNGKFVPLDPTKPIPLGSTLDTKNGQLLITALQTPAGKPQSAKFSDGVFKITQTKQTTDLTLDEALAKCGTGARAAAKKPKSRKLWGDGSGSFRTRGQYSAATVRGTRWLVQDSCAGTLTQVKTGTVAVRDNVKRKTIILRAGKKYLARPKK